MVHWPITPHAIRHFTEEAIPLPSVEQVFAALRKLQGQGKVRTIGVSNFAAPKVKEALDTGTVIAVNQLPYSLVARAIEYEILPLCRQLGVGVMGYMPLWQGLLTDRYDGLDELALRWALACPGMSCVLAGARSRQQLEANAAAATGAP